MANLVFCLVWGALVASIGAAAIGGAVGLIALGVLNRCYGRNGR